MPAKTWTDEQYAILDSEYPTVNLKELAGRLGKTKGAIKSKALIRKLKRSPEAGEDGETENTVCRPCE